MPITTPLRKDGNNEPAYALQVWSYNYAPIEYRNYFAEPNAEDKAFIVYQRHIVDNWNLTWIAPNGRWWGLWFDETIHDIDEHTKVYLLIEMVRGTSP